MGVETSYHIMSFLLHFSAYTVLDFDLLGHGFILAA